MVTRIHRSNVLTAEQAAKVAAIQDQLKSKPSVEGLLASGEFLSPLTMGDYFDIANLLAAMKDARTRAGMSLREWSEASGVDYAALSRLENGITTNPTIHTLIRCARALRKRIQVNLVDDQNTTPMIPAVASNLKASICFEMPVVVPIVQSLQFIPTHRGQLACVG